MCVCVCVWGGGGGGGGGGRERGTEGKGKGERGESGRGSAEVGRGREGGGKGERGLREVERWEEGGEGGWRGEACESEAGEESVHVNSFTTDWGAGNCYMYLYSVYTLKIRGTYQNPYLHHTAIYTISWFMFQHGTSFPC